MRARAALAAILWRLGRGEEAVDHQRQLLRLNPNETRLRYRQAHWLLALKRAGELDELSPPTPRTSPPPRVHQGARRVRRRGDDAGSRGLLAEARAQPARPLLPDGRMALPKRLPAHRSRREKDATRPGPDGLSSSRCRALAWLSLLTRAPPHVPAIRQPGGVLVLGQSENAFRGGGCERAISEPAPPLGPRDRRSHRGHPARELAQLLNRASHRWPTTMRRPIAGAATSTRRALN